VLDYLNQNPLYIVLAIALAVWLGIYVYLFRIESKVKKLEKELRK